jgi:hypothetical protein
MILGGAFDISVLAPTPDSDTEISSKKQLIVQMILT